MSPSTSSALNASTPHAVTMAQVAKLAGVSPAAVSAVVNQGGGGGTIRVSDQTRQRIEKVIRQTGYRPNRVGKALSSGRSLLIAMVVRDAASSFVPQCIAGVEDVAEEQGYSVILTSTRGQPKRMAHAMDLAVRRHVDGLILGAGCQVDPARMEELATHDLRIVYVNHQPADAMPHSGSLCVDGLQVGWLGMSHLLEQGHRFIACMGMSSWNQQGIDQAATQANEAVQIEHWSFDAAAERPMEEVFQRWLAMRHRPTAMFFNGDHMACSFMNLAIRQGLKLPDDVSILGVDNAVESAHAVVPLTTVAQPKYEQGQQAAQILFDMLNDLPGRQMVLQPELLIRCSTQPPGQAKG